MKLIRKTVNTQTITPYKYNKIMEFLSQDSYSIVQCKEGGDGEIEAIMVSPVLLDMLITSYDAYINMIQHPDYIRLREQNADLKNHLMTLLNEFKQYVGPDAEISEDYFNMLKRAVMEKIKNYNQKTGIIHVIGVDDD